MLFSLLTAPASAAYVTDVAQPVVLERASVWVRTFENPDGGWWLFLGAGGGMVAPVDSSFAFKEDDLIRLTNNEGLQDHAITRCPDGGYLHVASYTTGNFNDSARAYRYDADWQLLAETVLEEGSGEHNDMAVVCSPNFQGVVFRGQGGGGGQKSVWFGVDKEGSVSGPVTLQDTPLMTGGAAMEVDGELWLWGTRGYQQDPLVVTRYSTDLSGLGEVGSANLSPDGGQPYWTQGLLRAGDVYLLAHMGRGQGLSFSQDTGNVYLSVLSEQLELLEQVRVSDYTGGDAGMRPGIMRDGETLVVSWDANLRPNLALVALDLSGAGSLDTGWDTGSTDSDSNDPANEGCGGCSGVGGGVGLLRLSMLALGVLMLAGVRRRRRR